MDVNAEEKQRIRDKIEKLKSSKFKQQTLKSWRPSPTLLSTTLTFSIFGIMFIGIGIVLFILSEQIFESEVRYDDECKEYLQPQNYGKPKDLCKLKMDSISQDIKGPVYVYYQLDNFHQNHRRYVKSRDSNQLNGNYATPDKLLDCDPVILVGDLWEHQKKNMNEQKLDDTAPAVPCGLVAKSFFNDTFILRGGASSSKIEIDQTNIAWASDKEHKFKNVQNNLPTGKTWKDVQWLDMEDEHFIVWMRTAGLPSFRKLWGRIEGGLTQGDYTVEINNQYEVAPFAGKKSFVLATSNTLGGKNYFLAVSYLVVGALCMFFAFIFCIAHMKRKNTGQRA